MPSNPSLPRADTSKLPGSEEGGAGRWTNQAWACEMVTKQQTCTLKGRAAGACGRTASRIQDGSLAGKGSQGREFRGPGKQEGRARSLEVRNPDSCGNCCFCVSHQMTMQSPWYRSQLPAHGGAARILPFKDETTLILSK